MRVHGALSQGLLPALGVAGLMATDYAHMTQDEFTTSFILATNKLEWAADALESIVFESKPDAEYVVFQTPADAYRDAITFLRAWSLISSPLSTKEES